MKKLNEIVITNIADSLDLEDKEVEITENGTQTIRPSQGYEALRSVEVTTNVSSGSGFTGHADAAGLRAIGWTDDDIAYYQEHGVNWNEEDDDMHLVTQANKDLYDVMNASNYRDYTGNPDVIYLPKIDFSTIEQVSFSRFYEMVSLPLSSLGYAPTYLYFYNCHSLVCIPPFDTEGLSDFESAFYGCFSLTHVPHIDTSSATTMRNMFCYCHSLKTIPALDTSSVTDMDGMFYHCYSLISIPALDTSSVTDVNYMFSDCTALETIPLLDFSLVTYGGTLDIFYDEWEFSALRNLGGFEGLSCDFDLSINGMAALSRDSILNVFNHLATVSSTKYLTLADRAKERLSPADIAIATNKGWTIL